MSNFEPISRRFPGRAAAFPTDWPKPTGAEFNKIEAEFGVRFSDEFKEFQLVACHSTPMGDVSFDNFGWAHPALGPMENLGTIVADAQAYGVPRELAPFRCDNSDYFCLTRDGRVVIWDHNSRQIEKDPRYQWASFSDWLLAGLLS